MMTRSALPAPRHRQPRLFGGSRALHCCACLAIFGFALFGLAGCGDDDDGPTGPGPDPELPLGAIGTWAGGWRPTPYDPVAGYDGDGHALLESSLNYPIDVFFPSTGEPYLIDFNNHRIRRLDPATKTLRTVVGTAYPLDGPPDESDQIFPGAQGSIVSLNHPTDLMELPDGKLLITCWHNMKLRTYDPMTGLVYVIAGSGIGFRDNVPPKQALFLQPTQSVLTEDGVLYVSDQGNRRIRKVTGLLTPESSDDMVTTVVGTGVPGFNGDDVSPAEAQLNFPNPMENDPAGQMTIDSQGRVYVSDLSNNRIRRIDFATNDIETIAGNGTRGYSGDGGPATAASLNHAQDLEFGPDGRLYIADELNNVIRVVDLTTGIIDTFAGAGTAGFSGDGGPAREAELNRPRGIAFDASGDMYIADTYNHRIRRINL